MGLRGWKTLKRDLYTPPRTGKLFKLPLAPAPFTTAPLPCSTYRVRAGGSLGAAWVASDDVLLCMGIFIEATDANKNIPEFMSHARILGKYLSLTLRTFVWISFEHGHNLVLFEELTSE